jgi:hypothetical protein
MMNYRLSIFLLLFVSSFLMKADDCSSSLKDAYKLFNEGQLEEAELLVQPCLKQNYYSKEDKRDVYKLLIAINLYEDRFDQADEYMRKFLKLYPEYVITSEDSADFIDLYKLYNTLPVYSIGPLFGANFSLAKGKQSFGVHDVKTNPGSYSSVFGFDFGASFHKNINQNFSFTAGLNYSILHNRYEVLMYANEMKLTYTENQSWLQLPFDIRYAFNKNKLAPYLGLGAKVGMLLSAKADVNREYTVDAVNSYSDVTINGANVKGLKKSVNLWGYGLIGAKYKIPHGSVYLQMVYNYALVNETNKEKRYTEVPELATQFYMVNDDVFLDHLSIQLGYYYHFYVARKKK